MVLSIFRQKSGVSLPPVGSAALSPIRLFMLFGGTNGAISRVAAVAGLPVASRWG